MNILLVRSGGIGDAILTLPVVRRLSILFPDAGIVVLGNPSVCRIAALTREVTAVYSINEARFAGLFSDAPLSGELSLFLTQFDAAYVFSAADSRFIAGRFRSGGIASCRVLDPRIPEALKSHASAYFLGILGKDAGHAPVLPKIAIAPADSRRGLVIHPGSGGVEKNWPVGSFLKLAGRFKCPVRWILGPAEMERGYGRHLAEDADVVAGVPLTELVRILASAACYIGNDSGVSHLAAWCETPSVVLFGPSDVTVWRPLGSRVACVVSQSGTMEGIDVSQVVRVVKKVCGQPD